MGSWLVDEWGAGWWMNGELAGGCNYLKGYKRQDKRIYSGFKENSQHSLLRRKSKEWLTQNQDNVSEWSDMCIHRLLFQCVSTKRVGLVQSRHHHHLIEN
jgi:hypothetical protein